MTAHMTAAATFSVALENEAATAALMADLALLIGPGDVVTLSGELGAGKTTAARALIRYLADDAALEVPSPTFTLVQGYELPGVSLVHADLYRVGDPAELQEIGLSPLPDTAICLIEWPERAGPMLPADRIDIAFAHGGSSEPDARAATITGFGKAAAVVARLKALRQFLDRSGFGGAVRRWMAGDASVRSYARLLREGSSFILMNSPPRPDGPPIYDGKSYSAAVHLAEDVKPFVAIAEGLRARGLSAPQIHHAELKNGFLIEEDLGTVWLFEGDPPRPIASRYEAAIDMLVKLHAEPLPIALPLAQERSYELPVFDIEALLVEIGLMVEWYLPDRGVSLRDGLRREFLAMWRELLQKPAAAAMTWVLRDFHSPNLLWLSERSSIARVGLIDFQDAVLGPAAYDLVSLLQDARLGVPQSLEIALLSRYVRARSEIAANFDAGELTSTYAIMSAQRNTRLLGTFARLNRRDGKPQYLRHQPRIWGYLERSLAHPALASISAWYAAHVPPPAL